MTRRLIGVVLAAAGLLAAACSSDGGDSAAPSTSGPPGSSAQATGSVPARYAGHSSEVYRDPAHWVCRPGRQDVCDMELDATVIAADGSFTTEPFRPAADPAIDCFYVYPTISRDEGVTSDLVPDPAQEIRVTGAQAARLGTHCRVFAPVYRQLTLTALTAAMRGTSTGSTSATTGGPDPRTVAYGDVVDAWKHYMANDNGGRGVVLIGHSQGSGHLNRLIREEIDPNPEVRNQLVAAYLAGAAVRVPEGRDVGGDFQNVPACRARDQLGCVLSWATFRSTSPPPPNARFGTPATGDGVALCTNPAGLAGGKVSTKPYVGSSPGVAGSMVGNAPADPGSWVSPPKEVTTQFVTLPGLVQAECVAKGGFNYLEVTMTGDPADPRADDIGGDLTPDWGLHLLDVSIVMGDIVDLVGAQAEAYGRR